MSSRIAIPDTQRSRSLSRWFLPAVLMVVAIGSVLAWKTVRGTLVALGRPFKVLKLTAKPVAADERSEAREARQSLRDVVRLAAVVAAAEPVRRVNGNAFIASAEQAAPLSPGQRTRLSTTFELAAKLQATIDATDDAAARADLQRRLDDQVRARLRMILPGPALALLGQLDDARGPVTFQFQPQL